MELTEAIIRARQIKMSLDKRVKGGLKIEQDKSIAAMGLAKTKKAYSFRVLFKVRHNANTHAIRKTVEAYGGRTYGLTVNPSGYEYQFELAFKLGEQG